jgi:hypothetical protein
MNSAAGRQGKNLIKKKIPCIYDRTPAGLAGKYIVDWRLVKFSRDILFYSETWHFTFKITLATGILTSLK